jgi:hypothetical protein
LRTGSVLVECGGNSQIGPHAWIRTRHVCFMK